MNDLELLKDARALIEGNWGQGQYSGTNDFGICYCAMGAVYAVAGVIKDHIWAYDDKAEAEAIRAERLLCKYSPGNNIISYNDRPTTTKEDILVLFDKAIEEVQKEAV